VAQGKIKMKNDFQIFPFLEKKVSHSVFCLPCIANLPIEKQLKIFEPTPINKSKKNPVIKTFRFIYFQGRS
jgi:hypothetical protein